MISYLGPVYTTLFSFNENCSVYTTPVSFHIGLGFPVYWNASLCTAVISLFVFFIHCAMPQMNRRLVGLILRFCIELIPGSTVSPVSAISG